MTETAKKTDPALWQKIKDKIERGSKGGKPGQWSARKAQLAVHDYKAAGGGYKGEKSPDNHLKQWSDEDWGTKSGESSAKTGERYLPQKARASLDEKEYARTTAKKRADTRKGKQFSAQPADIAAKTADARLHSLPVTELRKRAAAHAIAGRARMRKSELVAALSHHA